MSFSGEVKEELAKVLPSARHCQLAELAGLFHACGQYGRGVDGLFTVGFQTERESVVKKGFTLLRKTFNIGTDFGLAEGQVAAFLDKLGNPDEPVSPMLLKHSCCQRAFLRGTFLGTGSVSDPKKGYHLEFVCSSEAKARQLQQTIAGFEIEPKIISRKGHFVLYLKEGEQLADLLNVLGAPVSLMKLQNERIYKEVTGSVNRRVNCELSNIRKTVSASARQVEDIRYIRDHGGLEQLAPQLREMAYVRLEYPEMPLVELGKLLDPPIGKSGVNHRLRRLGEIADRLRNG